MEQCAPEHEESNEPTFGQMLQLVAEGSSLGFVVISEEWGISYRILEPGVMVAYPESGETLLPMSAEDARQLLIDLADEAEELGELGTWRDNPPNN